MFHQGVSTSPLPSFKDCPNQAKQSPGALWDLCVALQGDFKEKRVQGVRGERSLNPSQESWWVHTVSGSQNKSGYLDPHYLPSLLEHWNQMTLKRLHRSRTVPTSSSKDWRLGSKEQLWHMTQDRRYPGAWDTDRPCCFTTISKM